MSERKIAIAIDGPAAAGKSTVAKRIAQKLNYIYIDTGAMYRAITYVAIESQQSLADELQLYQLLLNTDIELSQGGSGQKVIVNGKDITEDIRNQQVTNSVSKVAAYRLIREEMVIRQRELAGKKGVVMDGRDIGSHVIPDAEVKIFLIASVRERAERRYYENKRKGFEASLAQLEKEIAERDKLDSERTVSPLIKAEDAIELDTTSLTIDQVTNCIFNIINEKVEA
ncbi:cytidylate kinase [Amphibacillus marinus]|uniref:Cytidylate kinase n=1 Tax=Amphibacillus marinus TaxID=872970 RepID=A0A1H8GER2_9BACI|nr:(d)CMP kinase [Amphibacillus marinus]SEN42299.1 cytidylate kinase [Amphibacillus marinus]